MAEISGKVAKVEYAAGKVDSLDEWNMTINSDMLDVTTFTTGTVQWREFITGLSDWSGTVSGNFDAASTGLTNLRTNTLTPTTGQLILYMDKAGGENFRGSTIISTMNVSAPIEGKVEIDFSFQGTGALSFSSAT